MREIIIKENEAGQRFDKYLKKYLPKAPGGFLYKMLRKKNILLNEKKASGGEKLSSGDRVKFFLSEETMDKFSEETESVESFASSGELSVIYEDLDILVLNKPAGMLSQKAKKGDISVVEVLTGYLLKSGALKKEELKTFRPGVCNRLDRNTSGLIVAGKSLLGLQVMSELFKSRALKKNYLCIVKGCITEGAHIRGYLKKEERTNRAEICKEPSPERMSEFTPIETEYFPVAYHPELTLLKVHLITGKTHQIRAQLAALNHPIVGDYKYGERAFNDVYKKRYQIEAQLLHAYELILPEIEGAMSRLSGQVFYAPAPPVFYRMIEDIKWQHGIQEALEVLHWRR